MRVAFIGAGNMAQAMMGGMLRANKVSKEQVIATAATQATLDKVSDAYGVQVTLDNRKAAEADIIVLAVKPVYYATVIEEIRDIVTEEQLIVTIAAGKSLEWVEQAFGKPLKIIRTMPNTPALVGEGVTAVCPNKRITDEDLATVCELLRCFGKAEVISEKLMDAVVAVSGSSPAYVFMFIEAMADAAVAEGMPRAQAYQFAAQSVLGSAKMVLETGKHPGELKDMVCSPAGTTIDAVRSLEQNGFRGIVMDAMHVCAEKNRTM
ncbi:MAG: pyrroline-5-carboxylate reductase [Lachnospiraceae bacterium]|nr:pyrroline-5-carboxylate reductase [Lachnospiraceae bacterium]